MTVPDIAPRARAAAGPARARSQDAASYTAILVEVADAARFAAVAEDWRTLADGAAEPNVFMEPAFVTAAAACGADIRILLAWRFGEPGRTALAGAWPLRLGYPPSHAPLRLLTALSPYAFLGTPVVDAGQPTAVLRAMLDTVALSPELPKTMLLSKVATDGPTFAALAEQLRERGAPMAVVESRDRPKLDTDLSAEEYLKRALSTSSRKKLRQHRRNLERRGRVELVRHAGARDVGRGFERFLALEAAGWKGRAGTAIACHDGDRRLARQFVEALAADGLAWLESLTLDGEPIAMQVMLRSGAEACTWRTCYDERYAERSPGVLLLQEVTAKLLTDPQIAVTDSCSHEATGYMADLWLERRTIADICLDVRPGRPLAWQILGAAEAAYLEARRLRRRLRRAVGPARRPAARRSPAPCAPRRQG